MSIRCDASSKWIKSRVGKSSNNCYVCIMFFLVKLSSKLNFYYLNRKWRSYTHTNIESCVLYEDGANSILITTLRLLISCFTNNHLHFISYCFILLSVSRNTKNKCLLDNLFITLSYQHITYNKFRIISWIIWCFWMRRFF